MRVGIDATSWGNRRGYGRFARNAVRSLVELDLETTYVLFVDAKDAGELDLPPLAERREVGFRRSESRSAEGTRSRRAGDLLRLSRATRGDGLEAFLFPSVYTYFPVFGMPTIVGVHDTIANDFPALTLPGTRARLSWRMKERNAIRRASRLFTVSEASRRVLVERFRLRADDIAIVPEAPDPVFSPRQPDAIDPVLRSLGIAHDDSFLLFVGGISPHKNLSTLLDAYALLGDTRTGLPRLVLVGELDSDPYLSAAATVRHQIQRLGLESKVVLPGFVSDEMLACLYSAAVAVVLPSLAEGFGLPAVEAAACGAATILSDLPAHRESLREDALYFSATDSVALAEQISLILDDETRRVELAERGRRTVSRLSWSQAGERLHDLVVEAVAR